MREQDIVIAKDILEPLSHYLARYEHIAFLSDENTVELFAEQLPDVKKGRILPGDVTPSMEVVESVRPLVQAHDVLVVIGSGTLNDIGKYASFLAGKPYAVIGTAPSMNGYVSANASISKNGFKHSLAAAMPEAAFFDLNILTKAPKRLIRSGIGDSLCRATVQSDWLLSHAVLGTAYDAALFAPLRQLENELITHIANDPFSEAAIRILMQLLIASGLSMVKAGSSYPASQGEHMIAHTMEMCFGERLPMTYHGEEIAVTSLYMAGLQEHVIAAMEEKNFQLPVLVYDELRIKTALPQTITKDACNAYQKKCTLFQQRRDFDKAAFLKEIASFSLPQKTLKTLLTQAGCPTTPEALGWKAEFFHQATEIAKYTRDRFTFLDIV